jgi:adenosine deaminase
VGLASNAYERPPMLFEEGFNLARADGLHITMHCDFGQKDTHAHMNEAIFQVCEGKGSERIDHGLDAEDREELWRGLLERQIGLTLCPHAYHRRTPTEVLFPKIRRLLERGVKICINSDDPTLMHDVWIEGNMQKVYTYCGFDKAEMVKLARNAVDMSWASDDEKVAIYRELDDISVV